jgi:hypothetical protein
MYQQLVDTLNDLIEKGVEQGVFRNGIDPVDLYISISSLSAYIVDMILRYVCRSSDDDGQSGPATLARFQRNPPWLKNVIPSRGTSLSNEMHSKRISIARRAPKPLCFSDRRHFVLTAIEPW